MWPFQQKILHKIGGDTLILGLPTGLGKTYLAGAYLESESSQKPLRVLFLTPSIPLGVQQALFAQRILKIEDAYLKATQNQPLQPHEIMEGGALVIPFVRRRVS